MSVQGGHVREESTHTVSARSTLLVASCRRCLAACSRTSWTDLASPSHGTRRIRGDSFDGGSGAPRRWEEQHASPSLSSPLPSSSPSLPPFPPPLPLSFLRVLPSSFLYLLPPSIFPLQPLPPSSPAFPERAREGCSDEHSPGCSTLTLPSRHARAAGRQCTATARWSSYLRTHNSVRAAHQPPPPPPQQQQQPAATSSSRRHLDGWVLLVLPCRVAGSPLPLVQRHHDIDIMTTLTVGSTHRQPLKTPLLIHLSTHLFKRDVMAVGSTQITSPTCRGAPRPRAVCGLTG